jgi:hypothetical protein
MQDKGMAWTVDVMLTAAYRAQHIHVQNVCLQADHNVN